MIDKKLQLIQNDFNMPVKTLILRELENFCINIRPGRLPTLPPVAQNEPFNRHLYFFKLTLKTVRVDLK